MEHRPTLLLIHGFPLDSTLWEPQVEALSRVATVIAPDLRGFGRDEREIAAIMPMRQYAHDLKHLLDEKGLDKVVICGLSMGGYIAMAFAERWPETTITKQSAQYYDPTTYAGRELAGSLKTRFNDVRERYREEAAAVPSTARAHRIRKLEEIADRAIALSLKAEQMGNLAFAEKLLDRAQNLFKQIAEEMGDVYTNTHKLSNPDGTGVLNPLTQLLGMIDGGTRSLAPKE
jgi:pimeloyl-ACP methyl ester carboxylesterase